MKFTKVQVIALFLLAATKAEGDVAANGEAAVVEGEGAAVEGEAAVAEGESAAAEGESAAAEGEAAASAEGEAVATAEGEAAANGETPTADANSEATAVEGEASVEGEAATANDGEAAAAGEAASEGVGAAEEIAQAQDIVVGQGELINGNCSSQHVVAGTQDKFLTVCSTLTACINDSECGTENEKCGSFVEKGTAKADTASMCVYQRACNNVGKRNGITFSIQCWDTSAPETLPDTDAYFENVATIVGQDGAATFTEVKNMKIPSKDNFQTGWWIRQDNTSAVGIYAETDKPVNNKCIQNSDCGNMQCCANWPDTNNKRCTSLTDIGYDMKFAPLGSFTPVCAASGNLAPASAKDDLAEEAQAQAAQAVTNFHELIEATLKTDLGYHEMSDEAKVGFDLERASKVIERQAFDDAQKEAAGYSELSNDSKAIYDAELLKWKKQAFENCSVKKESIHCRKANEIRTAQEAARKLNGYYSKTTADREVLDTIQADEDMKTISALSAAWIEENVPEAGNPGSSCSGASKCAGVDLCCGTATPKTNAPGVSNGQREGVCASKTEMAFTDSLGMEFSHVCGAQKLIAAGAAILAAAYLI